MDRPTLLSLASVSAVNVSDDNWMWNFAVCDTPADAVVVVVVGVARDAVVDDAVVKLCVVGQHRSGDDAGNTGDDEAFIVTGTGA
ncbi:unnamed protein product [Enterobius vermicularis]|uniref:Secreted protein n=1 Tax=Enterobius vermicularis TaxID=51028 RepID=A0A0N4VRB8_ENTVE|nr:unnamed protein product [Enterobius vermicularis]